MIKIGNLAKICKTSTQTLRYYDTEGVLKADYIDSETGYRFYKPEAVEKYRKIMFYKSLGFSLEEIKELTSLPKDQALQMMLRKKEALQSSIRVIQEQVAAIEDISQNSVPIRPRVQNMRTVPFVDDPEVIGKWSLCGVLDDENDISSFKSRDYPLKELILLPGGAPVWNYFWTKGILYRLLGEKNLVVPNPYRILSRGADQYMIIRYETGWSFNDGKSFDILLFRQEDNIAYSELQSRKFIDRTDLPFVKDPAVVGAWKAVDFVRQISDYRPNNPGIYTLYVLGYRFLPGGRCVKSVKKEEGVAEYTLNYTSGTLLNRNLMTAEAYQIRIIEGQEVLFVQHKSGDYIYGGMEPYWYVFIRDSN